eukprot:TRINITY_DN254_c0_g1_i1.p1 TRINITY_DN254_c0_g1~~TRINITY_DN254_c0_g1_i1.p1  ORF type:complete len:280 (-),score=1.59 TRINITY_DN254_c0_g1_i1:311-1120(-)
MRCIILLLIISCSQFLISHQHTYSIQPKQRILQQTTHNNSTECLTLHKQCLFIVGLYHAGSHALLDVLNQHPQIKMKGSDGGVFSYAIQVIRRILRNSDWGDKYEEAAQGGKYRMAWYNPEKRTDFEQAMAFLFNSWFSSGANSDDYIGFIQMEFGISQEYYKSFTSEISILRGLCQSSKIIFQVDYDVERIIKHGISKLGKSKGQRRLERLIYFYNRYHFENQNDTMIVVLDEIRGNSSRFQDIFYFLDLQYNPTDYKFDRFGDRYYH